jgi:L-cysteine:1D-myo-inositol 2-amino-2-deoxy-alpha-D-glucopyranoside ligase
VPSLPGSGVIPRIFDSATQGLREAVPDDSHAGIASLYVCGITPYDATHLGHANTYLAFDTLLRVWLDAGLDVQYVQNSTDVDDPLLERAARDGVDWRELAADQTELFRSDMERLRIVPPNEYIAVTEVVPAVAEAVHKLIAADTAYAVPSMDATGHPIADDVYFDSSVALPSWRIGDESSIDRETMLAFSAERGGDPDRPGKRDPLDPLLWRSRRDGEPAWETVLGSGRPGWHIECSVIALEHLAAPITVNGGGSDLIFPHHEFSAGHAAALTGHPLAGIYAHSGMVAYLGEKMSKSLGNLVLVSQLAADGVDPRAIRLALLSESYRSDWEWTDAHLRIADTRLAAWSEWAADAMDNTAVNDADAVDGTHSGFLTELRELLAADLDTPAVLAAIDARIAAGLPATKIIVDAVDALLGIQL